MNRSSSVSSRSARPRRRRTSDPANQKVLFINFFIISASPSRVVANSIATTTTVIELRKAKKIRRKVTCSRHRDTNLLSAVNKKCIIQKLVSRRRWRARTTRIEIRQFHHHQFIFRSTFHYEEQCLHFNRIGHCRQKSRVTRRLMEFSNKVRMYKKKGRKGI